MAQSGNYEEPPYLRISGAKRDFVQEFGVRKSLGSSDNAAESAVHTGIASSSYFQPRNISTASENNGAKPLLDCSKISNLAYEKLISEDPGKAAERETKGDLSGSYSGKKYGEANFKSRGGKYDDNRSSNQYTRSMDTAHISSHEMEHPGRNVTTFYNKGHKTRTNYASGPGKYIVDADGVSQARAPSVKLPPNSAKLQGSHKLQRQHVPKYVPVASIFGPMGYEGTAEDTLKSPPYKLLGHAKYLPVKDIFKIEDMYKAQLPLISFRTWFEMHDADDDPVLSSIVLFENGGRSIAELILDTYAKPNLGVVIVAGNTFNTPYVLSAGRHLKNHGIDVYLYSQENLDDADERIRKQYAAYKRCDGKVTTDCLSVIEAVRDKDEVLILEIIGSSLPYIDNRAHINSASRYSLLQACSQIISSHSNAELVCVDIPSIFGYSLTPAAPNVVRNKKISMNAKYTIVLGVPKLELLFTPSSIRGQIIVVDVGIPTHVLHECFVEFCNDVFNPKIDKSIIVNEYCRDNIKYLKKHEQGPGCYVGFSGSKSFYTYLNTPSP